MSTFGIITVVKDDFVALQNTIDSIKCQSVQPDEVLIISRNIDSNLIKNSIPSARVLCDVDSGLFDAMNIGLSEIAADAFIFLNAGDTFIDENAISILKKLIVNGFPVSFSCVQKYYDDSWIRPGRMRRGQLVEAPSHQGFVCPSNLKETKFASRYRISADTHWIKSILDQAGGMSVFYEKPLVQFSLGGISNYPSIKTVRLRFESSFVEGCLEVVKFLLHKILGSRKAYKILAQKRGYDYF
jgi:hypothetical protein